MRPAFTMLELLVAIAIISILAGLILTVAGSVNIRARETQVITDIKSLDQGIAAFKQQFGIEPPSRMTLYEQASGWTNATDPDAARSMGIIRSIWPQFDFTYANEPTAGKCDINGDGLFTGDGVTNTAQGEIVLTGAECLVFFLGGVPSTYNLTTNPPLLPFPTGFSTNPADPFNRSGTNRQKFTEFDASRLFLFKPPSPGTQHVMNTYMDTLPGQTMPYVYISSYGGQGYDITELVGSLTAPTVNGAPGQTFTDIYRQGTQGYWQNTPPPFTANPNTPSPPWNPNSYQIISPGGDGQYGAGGPYNVAGASGLLQGSRSAERDNLTNFVPNRLAP